VNVWALSSAIRRPVMRARKAAHSGKAGVGKAVHHVIGDGLPEDPTRLPEAQQEPLLQRVGISPSQAGASGQASGCDFNGVLGNVKVHKVWEGRVVGERIDSRSPSIRMFGLQYRLYCLACFLVNVIWVKDSSYGAPDVTTKDLLVKGFGPLLGRGGPLLGSQVSFHGS
jgi:hypothetical protein